MAQRTAGSTDGPSRPFGLEFALGIGVTVVFIVVVAVSTVAAAGEDALLYSVLAFIVGLLVWMPLLLLARRISADRPAAVRVLASALAALVAIGINLLAVFLIISPIGGYYGFYVVLAVVDSIGFLVAALVAAFIVHLTGSPAQRTSR